MVSRYLCQWSPFCMMSANRFVGELASYILSMRRASAIANKQNEDLRGYEYELKHVVYKQGRI